MNTHLGRSQCEPAYYASLVVCTILPRALAGSYLSSAELPRTSQVLTREINPSGCHDVIHQGVVIAIASRLDQSRCGRRCRSFACSMSLPPDDRAVVLTSGARECFKTCVPTKLSHTCVAHWHSGLHRNFWRRLESAASLVRVMFSRTMPIRSRLTSEKLSPMIEIPYLPQVSAENSMNVRGWISHGIFGPASTRFSVSLYFTSRSAV